MTQPLDANISSAQILGQDTMAKSSTIGDQACLRKMTKT